MAGEAIGERVGDPGHANDSRERQSLCPLPKHLDHERKTDQVHVQWCFTHMDPIVLGTGKNVRLYQVGMFFRETPGDSCRAAETAVSVSGIALPPFHPGVVLHTGLGPAAATCHCACAIYLLLRAALRERAFSRISLLMRKSHQEDEEGRSEVQ
jgi:hypothetical protein